MPRIEVWECPQTKKVFKTTDGYISHLKVLARKRLNERWLMRTKNDLRDKFAVLRRQCTNIDDIAQMIVDNSQLFVKNNYMSSNFMHHTDYGTPGHGEQQILTCKISIPNPNWHVIYDRRWDNQLHRYRESYSLGMKGQLNFTYDGRFPCFVSNIFTETGIYTGSGGGGGDRYSTEITIYQDDGWEGLDVMLITQKLSEE